MQHSTTGSKEATGDTVVKQADKIKMLNDAFDTKLARAITVHGASEVDNILRYTYESLDCKEYEINDKIGLLDRLESDTTVTFIGNPKIYFHTDDTGNKSVVVNSDLFISKGNQWSSDFDVQSISNFNCVEGSKTTATYTDDAATQPEPITLAHMEEISTKVKALIKQFYTDNGIDIDDFS